MKQYVLTTGRDAVRDRVLADDSRPTDRLVAKLLPHARAGIDAYDQHELDEAYERQLAALRATEVDWQKPAMREVVAEFERSVPFEQGETVTVDAVTEAAEPQVEAVEPTPAEPTIEDLVASISRAAASRYHDYVEHADVQQELQLFILENAAQVARWYNNSGFHRVALALRGAAKRYCETEKAAASGYSFDDVAWYDPTMLEDLIPLALDERWDGTSPSSEDDDSLPRSKRDAAVGGTLLAMVMDVRRAIWRVGSDPTAVAEFLGGDYPGSKSQQKTPRRVLSNAAATAAISAEVSN